MDSRSAPFLRALWLFAPPKFTRSMGADIVMESLLPLPQDQRQPVLAVADNDDLSVGALGQGFGGLDPLPFEQRRRDTLRHNLLEVADARGLDALALSFLRLFLQSEVHREGFLLGLLLGLDGRFQRSRKLNIAQQNRFHRYPALGQIFRNSLLNLFGYHLALAGIEGVGRVRGSCLTDGGAQLILDHLVS